MKTLAKNFLITGFIIGAAGLTATPLSAQMEEWHRAKHGRPYMTEAARPQAPTPNIGTSEPGSPANTWFEQFYKTKFGRFSPIEEARQRKAEENVAFREEPVSKAGSQTAEWFDGWYRLKFGRTPPANSPGK